MLHLFSALYMISNELSNELQLTGPFASTGGAKLKVQVGLNEKLLLLLL